jgi:exodeoxyribonuclease V alpha subunit
MAQPSSCAKRQTEAFRGTTHVEPDDGELTATFDARVITYGFGELLPAYAATIHKRRLGIPGRGNSGYHAALQHAVICSTPGVTRGKKLVVLVGQKKAAAIAVRSIAGRRRWFKPVSSYNANK